MAFYKFYMIFSYQHTEEREEGMDVEEGEMGDEEAPTSW